MIKRLDWDSRTFKINIGLANVSTFEDLNRRVFKEQLAKYDLVYLISQKKISKFENYLFEDERVTYIKNTSLKVIQKPVFTVKFGIHKKSDFEKLALLSGRYSRFNLDPKFEKEKFMLLYHLWVEKYFLKDSSKQILFCQESDLMQGFLTLDIDFQKQTGTIGLIAVEEQFHGQGIGTSLIKSAENYLISMNIPTLCVTTQGCNDQAKRLYEKNQFRLSRTTFIYHLWK
jgi:ribosomal protein S18 acetylase RimI-like enzyme